MAGASTPCTLTYACVSIAADGKINVPMHMLSKIRGLTYPSTSTAVALLDSASSKPHKGNTNRINIDSSVFQTPDTVTSFKIADVDLAGQLADVKMSTHWTSVQFTNTNLTAIPAQIYDLTALHELFLDHNNIAAVPTSAALQSLKKLSLVNNNLTEFSLALPELETLDISQNPFAEFPLAVLEMPKLKELGLIGLNLNNVHLKQQHFDVLVQHRIERIFGNFSVSGCNRGYELRAFLPHQYVCVDTSDSSSTSATTNTTTQATPTRQVMVVTKDPNVWLIGACSSLVVVLLCLIAFGIYVRWFRVDPRLNRAGRRRHARPQRRRADSVTATQDLTIDLI